MSISAYQLDAHAGALQLLIINVEDQDFRDMLFDYRITRAGARCALATNGLTASTAWLNRIVSLKPNQWAFSYEL